MGLGMQGCDVWASGCRGVMYGPRDAGGVMYGPQDAGGVMYGPQDAGGCDVRASGCRRV